MSDAAGPPSRKGRSVRTRLLAIALLPMAVVLPAVLGLALFWWLAQFDALLIAKAKDDLIIARQYLHRVMEQSGERLRALSLSAAFERVADSGEDGKLQAFLDRERAATGLDFLYLVDQQGQVLATSPRRSGEAGGGDEPVVDKALAGEPATAIEVLSADELDALSPDMARRSKLELVPTEGAAETDRLAETRGMIIRSAAPAPLRMGQRGALVGGTLLNGNLAFVDTINDLIYTHADVGGEGQGTVTLFLDDVRIATNVRLFGEERALGTRVSRAVRDAVLVEGRTWLDSAFVVNDWYISAYEPIVDARGARVGMLYVGFLERPFRTARLTMLGAVVAAFCLAAALTVPVLLRWARGIFRPLERMDATMSAVKAGDLSARSGVAGADDEIGRLARHFDGLLDTVEERDRQLRDWAEELDARVAERTRQLEDTRRQLVMSEKLASIGEITAGVAHEINNPVAVIQGNLEVVREVLTPAALAEVGTEFRLIDEQVHRINMIVTRLLQFAKPTEYAGYVEPVAPGTVVADSLLLVRHLLNRAEIAVAFEDHASRTVAVSRTELQQVIINLMTNAIHAMPEGGRLTLRTGDEERGGKLGVAILVADTGSGIPAEHLKKIFDPFFTTRTHNGTGLGLSISYTLMARYDGTIEVESAEGHGSRFTVWLPVGDLE